MKRLLGILIAAVGALVVGGGFAALLISVGSIIDGLAISMLWNWYLVPTLGVKTLSIPVAIGLDLLLACFLGMRGLVGATKEDSTWSRIITRYTLPLIALATGWVALFWVV